MGGQQHPVKRTERITMEVLVRVVVVFLFLSGCGKGVSVLKDSQLRPLVISMSGNSTCKPTQTGDEGPNGTSFFLKSMKVANELEATRGSGPFMIASCYDADAGLISSRSNDGWRNERTDEASFIRMAHEQMHSANHVFIMGHSYGGWLAMKLLEGWGGDPNLVGTIDTIDPISKVTCSFSQPAGCIIAPQDIKIPQRVHIAGVSKIWVNTWQNNTFYLHSSLITEADINKRVLDLDHYTVATDDGLWEDIKQRAKRISSEN